MELKGLLLPTLHNTPQFGEKRKGDNMALMELQATQPNVEHTKIRIFNLITQCIKEIEKTVKTSAVTMRDVGIGVDKYITDGDSYIIELRLRM
jgi:hypothetical protein